MCKSENCFLKGTFATYLCIDVSGNGAQESVNTCCWCLRGFSKLRRFHRQVLIAICRSCTTLAAMETQLVMLSVWPQALCLLSPQRRCSSEPPRTPQQNHASSNLMDADCSLGLAGSSATARATPTLGYCRWPSPPSPSPQPSPSSPRSTLAPPLPSPSLASAFLPSPPLSSVA